MRSIVIAVLGLTLALVPAAQAQQVVAPAAVEAAPSLVEVAPHWSQPDAAGVRTVAEDSRSETVAATAARDISARSVLAWLGAAVVVVALIAFLR
jgi:hypothetical protein